MRIACWQTTTPAPSDMPGAQLHRLAAATARAATAGAALLVTPELFATGYPLHRRLLAEVNADYAEGVHRIAATTGVSIVHGLPEVNGTALHNIAAVVMPENGAVATYCKVHLYGEHEQTMFTPGDKLVVQAEVGGVMVGPGDLL